MHSIKLDETHKSKLTEMCKKLFPETENWMDNYVVVHRQTCDICVKEQVVKSIDFKECGESDGELFYITTSNESKIPWFEFCIIRLAPKILDNSWGDIETLKLKYFGYAPDIKTDHLIDYLYKNFKKN